MICKLSANVMYGNWESPGECIGKVGTIINVAHSFSRRRGRNIYWAYLEKVHWDVFYVRLAMKDRMEMTREYFISLVEITVLAIKLGKLPILCHCQMGGHRGPTAAIVVACTLGEGTFKDLLATALKLKPGLARGREYFKSMCRLMEES